MRFFNKYAYMGAIALVGAVGFTACSSEDDLTAQQNPTFDGESVKTQFAINIPYAGGNGTRMTEDIVQGQTSPTFRGMTNIKLIPFNAKPTQGTETNLGQVISLSDIEGLITTSNAKVYNDVTIPVGTQAVLFYGQAKTTSNDNFVNGAVTSPTDYSELSNVKFTPVNITTNTTDSKASALATWMTHVANATGWNSATSQTLIDLRTEYLKATAGSSNSVLRMMQYLYDAIKNISEDADVVSAIKTAITTETGVSDNSGTLEFSGTTLSGYPGNISLPDGAARVVWNGLDEFTVVSSAGNTGLNVASFDSYIYPAPLCYYVNSTVKTADTEVAMDQTIPWSDILNNLKGTSVTSTTRSIAINDVINYSVARLDLSVRFDAQRIPDYKDEGTNNSLVTIPTDGFSITGVLIGGQGEVGWNYVPASVGAKTIYDKTMPTKMCAKYATGFDDATKNYTLAFETEPNTDVNVAIEFTNGDTDFYGVDGQVIPAYGKFYLVGTLKASDASETSNTVFKQDYNTTAKFTVSSLKNAYNVLPDLRTPELKLGMSVDLTWQKGHVFDVEIGE